MPDMEFEVVAAAIGNLMAEFTKTHPEVKVAFVISLDGVASVISAEPLEVIAEVIGKWLLATADDLIQTGRLS